MSKSFKYPSFASKAFLQVLGSGSDLGCASLLLVADNRKYLFNCGEGLQRLACEYKTKVSRISNIFITSAIWKHVGGIAGVFLTLQSINEANKYKNRDLVIHAPKGVEEMINALQHSSILFQVNGSVDTIDSYKVYNDKYFNITYIPIYPNVNNTHKCTSDIILDHDVNDTVFNSNEKRIHNKNITDKRIKLSEQDLVPTISYICKLHDKPGTLNVQKCIDKGIKPGPLLGLLKHGRIVTLDDGTIVKPEDVCGMREEGPTFMVVDCPNESFIESFVNETAFHKYQKRDADEYCKPFCIVHFTPEKIITNSDYKNWMNNFDPNTYHLIINNSNACTGSEAIYKQQYILNLLHPKIFPMLDLKSFLPERTLECQSVKTDNIQKVHYAKTLQHIELRPGPIFNTETTLKLDPDIYMEEVYKIDNFSTSLKKLHSVINEKETLLENEKYPQVVTLGTASGAPNKIRNTSCIIIKIDEERIMLLDCGEGTLCQMTRLYGLSKIDQVLNSIKAIYISHIHADHHLGLIGIIKAREKVTKDPILLLIPHNLQQWLKKYHNNMEPIEHCFKIVSNQSILDTKCIQPSVENKLYSNLNIKKITTTLVKHCPFAYGVSIVFNNDKKIVYSGDTMPCRNLINLGKNCDLLIHEATLQDDLKDEAEVKKHSTTSEAIGIGEEMGAGFTLLTHFSQRNVKLPILPNETKFDLSKVGLAYDYMHFNLSQLKLLPLFYSCLKIIYLDYYLLAELRTTKREQLKIKDKIKN